MTTIRYIWATQSVIPDLMTISIVDDGDGDHTGNDYKRQPSQRGDNDNKDLYIMTTRSVFVCLSAACFYPLPLWVTKIFTFVCLSVFHNEHF